MDERPHEQHDKVGRSRVSSTRSKLPLDEVCEYADLSAPLDRSILRDCLAAMSSGATWWKNIAPDNVYGCSPTARMPARTHERPCTLSGVMLFHHVAPDDARTHARMHARTHAQL